MNEISTKKIYECEMILVGKHLSLSHSNYFAG